MTKGRISRAEYLDRSLSRQQPWVAEGISRRTWERRRRLQNRDASLSAVASPAQADSPDADARAIAEALASVERIYVEMAEESARRARWWALPVDVPPDCISIRSALTGDVAVIRLDGDPARQKRKAREPAAHFWWDAT